MARARSPEIRNRRAFFDYEIIDRYEAGIALKGSEVKSIREGRADLRDAFVKIIDGEAFLVNAYIAPYTHGGFFNHEPLRTRKLLMHKREISRLSGKLNEKGLSAIPLRIYFNEKGKVKVEVAVVRGRKKYDKREKIKKRDQEREVLRTMKMYL